MSTYFFAAAWDDFFKLLPFIIVVLFWVINKFAGQLQPPQPPQKRVPPLNPPEPRQQGAGPPGQQPLQAEIEEFLRQAQALREGRPAAPRNQPVGGGRPAAQEQRMPPGAGAGRQGRPARRAQQSGTKRNTAGEMRPNSQRQAPSAPPAAQAEAAERPRESVAQYVAEHIDNSKFAERAGALSNIQKETDEFQQHMQRVFEHGMGRHETGPLGVFESAGAAAAAAQAAAATSATTLAGGAQSATAPTAVRKSAGNIALFLAGRKNIRDAIILTEILQRPEHRW